MASERGTVHATDDGRVAIRFVRLFEHPPEKVWRALTDPEQLAAWFPAVVDLAAEGELFFGVTERQRATYGMEDDPERKPNGRMLRHEPPSVLEYEWLDEILTWELTGTAEGCRLVFTNVLSDREAAGPAAAGWEAGLEVVAAQLDGVPITWDPFARADELASEY
ncbi:SRPBCC domain-containing protein [Kribbella endophytica]